MKTRLKKYEKVKDKIKFFVKVKLIRFYPFIPFADNKINKTFS